MAGTDQSIGAPVRATDRLRLSDFLVEIEGTTASVQKPLRDIQMLWGLASAVLLALTLVWLVPEIGLDSRSAERAVLSLIAFGIATAGLRRATVLQVLGIVLVENGLALAALELPGETASAAIEVGVAVDLMLISVVAVVFHQRIFGLFGAGDTAALRALRD